MGTREQQWYLGTVCVQREEVTGRREDKLGKEKEKNGWRENGMYGEE